LFTHAQNDIGGTVEYATSPSDEGLHGIAVQVLVLLGTHL
jgi:hypothetical protein